MLVSGRCRCRLLCPIVTRTADRLRVILRAATNREAGWHASFAVRADDCIASAERRIDAFCGRTFDRAAQATRSFRVSNAYAVQLDDIDLSQPVSVTHTRAGQTTTGAASALAAGTYTIRRSVTSYNVGRWLIPDRTELLSAGGRHGECDSALRVAGGSSGGAGLCGQVGG